MEGRAVLVAGRLVVVAAVGLVGFLFGPGAAEAGRLGLVARGLAFAAAGLAEDVAAAGFRGFQKAKSSIKPTKKYTTKNSAL